MKILITGSHGQLGKSIQKISPQFSGYKFTFTDVDDLDITNYNKLKEFLVSENFDVIINCAAYTAVDKAEDEPKQAKLLNATAPGYLARISSEFDIFLIHISTDFVFGGEKNIPYTEEDKPAPTSNYGKTKFEGENEIITNAKKAAIFRTSWLYSEFGHNFVKTVIRLTNEKDTLNIVDDQIGTPTFATDLADVILKLLPDLIKSQGVEIYHYSNGGKATWYNFAKEIIRLCYLKCKVKPIETKDYPLPAQRPKYSLMNKSKIINNFGIEIPEWKQSLKKCLKLLQT